MIERGEKLVALGFDCWVLGLNGGMFSGFGSSMRQAEACRTPFHFTMRQAEACRTFFGSAADGERVIAGFMRVQAGTCADAQPVQQSEFSFPFGIDALL